LPPELAQRVNQALLDGQASSDFWALAELNKVKQAARNLTPEQAAQAFADASTDPSLLLGPGMAQQNPTALIAAAQRQNALANYAAGGRGTQAFAALNRLVDVDLRGRIIGAVEFHLASGDSWRQLRSTLQNSVELTKSRAQTVARTEMAAAMVEGTKLRYEAEGIQQVQWQAVGSSRTCGYCAPRHGKVYRLGEVVAPAHPNCRCTVTPWDPEWVELGLVDPQAEAKSRAAVLADLEAAGKKPISGPSPFEKALGMDQAPEALWTPPRVGAAAKAPTQDEPPSQAESLRRKGSELINRVAPQINANESILRKAKTVLAARTKDLAEAQTPEAKEAAKAAYLKAIAIVNKSEMKTKQAMSRLFDEMKKTPLTEKEIKDTVARIDLSKWGTKRDLKKQVKDDVSDFIRLFNGKGFTATSNGVSWVKEIAPDLNGRGFNQGGSYVAVRIQSTGNLFHELMHTVESQRPWMVEAAKEWASSKADSLDVTEKFLKLRGMESGTRMGKPVFRLADITGSNYSNAEIAWHDDYLNPYMGKVYDTHDATEVWTMAVETIASGRAGMMQLHSKHPDLFRMLVGLTQTTS
jgi:SPP1 gp7 family putative phage head morphogenesis protein